VRLLTIVVVVLLAVFGAGCGGGDDDEASDDTTVAVETDTDTTLDTTTDETETTDTDTDGDTSVLASSECQELVSASVAFSQAIGAAGAGSDDNLDEVATLFDEYAERAPEEIQEDIRVLGDAYAEYAEVLADIQLEPGQVPDAQALQRLQEAIASIDQTEVAAAAERLSTWAQTNC
jgi:hypothetical protein